MKKLLLPALFASLIIVSCKKDKNNSSISGDIVGKWHFTADTIIVDIPGFINDTTTNDYQSGDYLQFNSNGSGTEMVSAASQSDAVNANFTYKLSGNMLYVNFLAQSGEAAYNDTIAVKTLTSSKLVMFYDRYYTESGVTSEEKEHDYLAK